MTPGPWKVIEIHEDPDLIDDARDEINIVAEAILDSLIARLPLHSELCSTADEVEPGQQRRNAQAIAALPDLIEALQLMVKEIESWHRIGEYERASVSIDGAKEALKKAGVE